MIEITKAQTNQANLIDDIIQRRLPLLVKQFVDCDDDPEYLITKIEFNMEENYIHVKFIVFGQKDEYVWNFRNDRRRD